MLLCPVIGLYVFLDRRFGKIVSEIGAIIEVKLLLFILLKPYTHARSLIVSGIILSIHPVTKAGTGIIKACKYHHIHLLQLHVVATARVEIEITVTIEIF